MSAPSRSRKATEPKRHQIVSFDTAVRPHGKEHLRWQHQVRALVDIDGLADAPGSRANRKITKTSSHGLCVKDFRKGRLKARFQQASHCVMPPQHSFPRSLSGQLAYVRCRGSARPRVWPIITFLRSKRSAPSKSRHGTLLSPRLLRASADEPFSLAPAVAGFGGRRRAVRVTVRLPSTSTMPFAIAVAASCARQLVDVARCAFVLEDHKVDLAARPA